MTGAAAGKARPKLATRLDGMLGERFDLDVGYVLGLLCLQERRRGLVKGCWMEAFAFVIGEEESDRLPQGGPAALLPEKLFQFRVRPYVAVQRMQCKRVCLVRIDLGEFLFKVRQRSFKSPKAVPLFLTSEHEIGAEFVTPLLDAPGAAILLEEVRKFDPTSVYCSRFWHRPIYALYALIDKPK